MKNIIDVYEASLLDIDGTIEDGDNIVKEQKEAERDWKKLINSKRTKEVLRGRVYKLHIKSPSLAKYLCRNIPDVDLTNLEFVDIHFKIDDALYSTEHYIAIQVASESYIEVKSADKIQYDDGRNPSDILPVKEAIKIITNNIAHSKYLQNVEDVREEFEKYVWFKKNMYIR